MRLQVTALILGVLGALGGGWLVGIWCFGVVMIVLSGALIAWGLLHDDGAGRVAPSVHEVPTLANVLERARRAS
jgi:Fe2+ transport system protein B